MNSMIFDPSGGLFQTGSWEDGLPLLDVDQYAWDHYGRVFAQPALEAVRSMRQSAKSAELEL